jgi:hypothetical protein
MLSLGLSKQYGKKDSEVSQFLKKLFGLSLLPPVEVCNCFALEFLSNLPNDKRVEQFCNYLLENYIDAESTFPSPVWSECIASSLRTINACESFHAHFNALFYSAHPNIFVLVRGLFQNQPPIGWLKEYKIQKKTLLSETDTYISALLLHIVAIHI